MELFKIGFLTQSYRNPSSDLYGSHLSIYKYIKDTKHILGQCFLFTPPETSEVLQCFHGVYQEITGLK